MREYIKSLSFRNRPRMEEVLEPCNRLLRLLQMENKNIYADLTKGDVLTILKANLFLVQSIKTFGSSLIIKLLEDNPHFASSNCPQSMCDNLTIMAFRKILLSSNGVSHLLVLSEFFNQFLSNYTSQDILKVFIENGRIKENNMKIKEAEYLLCRVFEIEYRDLSEAVERVATDVEFDVVLKILLHEATGIFSENVTVFNNKFFNMMDKSSKRPQFLKSIHKSFSYNDDGLQNFFKCLGILKFQEKFMNFSIRYLEMLRAENNEVSISFDFENLTLYRLVFLIVAALSVKSPCRVSFYKQLYSSNINLNVINYLKKTSHIFEL